MQHEEGHEEGHEEEEEEKSFFVFEGSTGGWKHATTGQMDESAEAGNDDMFSEMDQLELESECGAEDSSKKKQESSKEVNGMSHMYL